MPRTGSRLGLALIVGVLVLGVAAGLFALQLSQAYAQCSALPGSAPCAGISPGRVALDGVFIACAGLVAAAIMALASGVSWRRGPALHGALARQLGEEDDAFKREQARRAEVAQLNAMALAHAVSHREVGRDDVAASATEVSATDSADDNLIVSGPHWRLEEEKSTSETVDQARRRALADRLKTLAKNRPDTVANVLRVWINQPRPGK